MLKIFENCYLKRLKFLNYYKMDKLKKKLFFLKVLKKLNYNLSSEFNIMISDMNYFYCWDNIRIFTFNKIKYKNLTVSKRRLKFGKNEKLLNKLLTCNSIYITKNLRNHETNDQKILNTHNSYKDSSINFFKNNFEKKINLITTKLNISNKKNYSYLFFSNNLNKNLKVLKLKTVLKNLKKLIFFSKIFTRKDYWYLSVKKKRPKVFYLKISRYRFWKKKKKILFSKANFKKIYKKKIFNTWSFLRLTRVENQEIKIKKIKKKNRLKFFKIYSIYIKWNKKFKEYDINLKYLKFMVGLKILFNLKNYSEIFLKEIKKIKKKSYKYFFNKILTYYFIFKNSSWESFVKTVILIKIEKNYNQIFKKFKLYLPFFYSNNWDFYEGLSCKIKLFFLPRNLIITLKRITYFAFATMGFIVQKQQHKVLKSYQIMLVKAFFTTYQTMFDRNLTVTFEKPSKRINIFFFYLKYYIKKFNKEIYKKKYLRLSIMNFYRSFSKNNLKGPKKPRRKKFVVKKKKKYQF